MARVREEKRGREKIRAERVRRKKRQVGEEVESRDSLCFSNDLLLRSRLANAKNCTALWREAHLQVKKLKAPHVGSIFRS